jgi:hypothetical protein
LQHCTGYARRTRVPKISIRGSDTALHATKQKSPESLRSIRAFGEHLGIYKVLSEILGC